jgi:hypothetical protein
MAGVVITYTVLVNILFYLRVKDIEITLQTGIMAFMPIRFGGH